MNADWNPDFITATALTAAAWGGTPMVYYHLPDPPEWFAARWIGELQARGWRRLHTNSPADPAHTTVLRLADTVHATVATGDHPLYTGPLAPPTGWLDLVRARETVLHVAPADIGVTLEEWVSLPEPLRSRTAYAVLSPAVVHGSPDPFQPSPEVPPTWHDFREGNQ